jgi:hypothetical protein
MKINTKKNTIMNDNRLNNFSLHGLMKLSKNSHLELLQILKAYTDGLLSQNEVKELMPGQLDLCVDWCEQLKVALVDDGELCGKSPFCQPHGGHIFGVSPDNYEQCEFVQNLVKGAKGS